MTASERPLVSIIITNYNYGRFLRTSVESALGQRYDRLEVIVVDDGSVDESRTILREYEARIPVLFQEHGGQACALNRGFAACRGDIVMFLDADDVLRKDAVDKVTEAWRPGLAKIQFDLRFVDQAGRPTGRTYAARALPSGDLRQDLLDGINIYPPTSGNAYDRKVLERLLPLPGGAWSLHADSYLAWLTPFHGDVLSFNEPLGDFRLHGANNWKTTGHLTPLRLRQELEVLLATQALLTDRRHELGIDLADDWLISKPPSLKVRLAHVLNPEGSPMVPGDTRWTLTLEGLRSVRSYRRYGLAKKLLYAGWFLMVGLLPAWLTGPLQRIGLNPRSRSRAVTSLVGG